MTLALVTNNATLLAAVAAWLKRDDLTDSIPLFVQAYESQMNRELALMEPPHRSLEQTATGTLTSGSNTVALPTGYTGTKRFKITTSGNNHILTYKTPAQMAVYEIGGTPLYYTTIGSNLEVNLPDGDYTYSWTYDANLASITAGSNWVVANAPDMYLYGTLLHSAPYLKNDSRLETWGLMYSTILTQVEQVNTKNRQSGSPLQIRSDVAF